MCYNISVERKGKLYMSLKGTLFKDCYGDAHFNVDNAVGHVAFDIDDYENEEQMFIAIGQFMRILNNAGYHVIAGWDDKGCGIFVIRYADISSDWSEDYIEVLNGEEYDAVKLYRLNKLDELMKAHNGAASEDDYEGEFTAEL